MTANLLTLNSAKTEFLLIGLKSNFPKYITPHSTPATLLATSALSVMNTSPFLAKSYLSPNPAIRQLRFFYPYLDYTKRPASADRTARRQFQATGQPMSWTQASDAMTSRLPRYEAKCVQRRCFQCGSVPLRSDIKGTELPLPIYWYHSKGNWLRYNSGTESFYTTKLCINCHNLFILTKN